MQASMTAKKKTSKMTSLDDGAGLLQYAVRGFFQTLEAGVQNLFGQEGQSSPLHLEANILPSFKGRVLKQ